MKNIITLLLGVFVFLFFSAKAQPGTPCNSSFSFVVNGYDVQFIPAVNTDTASLRHTWIFGDGGMSYQADPLHTYGGPGVVVVTHIVTRITSNGGIACTDSSDQSVALLQTACNAHAAFTFTRDSLYSNVVYFNNQSAPQLLGNVKWSFGDGSVGFGYNAVHTYTSAGLYNVCLTVYRDALCRDSVCHPVQVQVSSVPPCNAAFTNTVTNNLVQFTGLSSGGQFYDYNQWDFGDGNYGYTANPQHLYQSAGVFTVTHTIIKYSGNTVVCADSVAQTVTISSVPCALQASFSFVRDSFQTNKIHFINTSATNGAPVQTLWSFGDGTSSADINPVHSFAASGAYTVCLLIKRDSLCSSDTCRVVQVQVSNQCNLQAGFITNVDSIQLNKVYFTNLSNPLAATDSVRWNFGDGTFSADVNPVHIYQQPGTYTVCLRVKKNNSVPGTAACVREVCQTIVVVAPCDIRPVFSFVRDSVQTNKVYFSNLSSGITPNTIARWSFGDGTYSYDNSPTHTYSTSGLFTVCLQVQRDSLCVGTSCLPVQVQVPNTCNLVANFSSYNDSLQSLLVHFINLSSPLASSDSVRWTFGDGSSSADFNPSHIYNQGGTYTVCLRVKKNSNNGLPACVKEVCRTIVVQQPTVCNLVANFSFSQDSFPTFAPFSNQFTNTSVPLTASDSSFWNFGDSSPVVINVLNPAHTFAAPGTYVVCLTVKKAGNPGTVSCIRQTCKTIVIQQQPACNLVVDFTFYKDSIPGTVFNTYHFSNQSAPAGSMDSLSWNFGDGSPVVTNQQNPLHTFTAPGTYIVCLAVKRATALGTVPCVRQVCKTIIVVQQPPACDFRVGYNWYRDSSNAGKIYFSNNTNLSAANATATWTFGDGSSATGWNAQHVYTQPGMYFACLNVNNGANCVRSFCDTVVVGNTVPPVDSCSRTTAGFAFRHDNYMPNKYFFFAQGRPPVVSQHWVITKMSTGAVVAIIDNNNPEYVFRDTGYYNVCLTALLANGCSKVICRGIRVSSITPAAQCYLQAFPNPAHSFVKLNVQLAQAETISITVYNAQNNIVRQITQQGFTGNNLVTITNLGGLCHGVYTIRIMHGGQVCRSRFFKL